MIQEVVAPALLKCGGENFAPGKTAGRANVGLVREHPGDAFAELGGEMFPVRFESDFQEFFRNTWREQVHVGSAGVPAVVAVPNHCSHDILALRQAPAGADNRRHIGKARFVHGDKLPPGCRTTWGPLSPCAGQVPVHATPAFPAARSRRRSRRDTSSRRRSRHSCRACAPPRETLSRAGTNPPKDKASSAPGGDAPRPGELSVPPGRGASPGFGFPSGDHSRPKADRCCTRAAGFERELWPGWNCQRWWRLRWDLRQIMPGPARCTGISWSIS